MRYRRFFFFSSRMSRCVRDSPIRKLTTILHTATAITKWSYTQFVLLSSHNTSAHTQTHARFWWSNDDDDDDCWFFSLDGSLVHPLVFGISLMYTLYALTFLLSLSLSHSFVVIIVAVCCFRTPQVQEPRQWVRRLCECICVYARTLRKTNESLCGFVQPVDIYASVRLRVILWLCFVLVLICCLCFFFDPIRVVCFFCHYCCCCCWCSCFIFYKICFTLKTKKSKHIYTRSKKKKKQRRVFQHKPIGNRATRSSFIN